MMSEQIVGYRYRLVRYYLSKPYTEPRFAKLKQLEVSGYDDPIIAEIEGSYEFEEWLDDYIYKLPLNGYIGHRIDR